MSAKGQKRTCQKKRDRVAAVSLKIASHAFRPVDSGIQTGPYMESFPAPAAASSASSEVYKKRISCCAFSTISVITLILLLAPLPVRLARQILFRATRPFFVPSFARVLAVLLAHKNHHHPAHCGHAGRGHLAVTLLRLPLCEVDARDNHEAEKPEGKADS